MVDGVTFGPGDIIAGKYRVERVLGSGGMGVVIAARHIELDERVAIKLLRKEALAREGARERFLREARAAVKLKSAHVARVSDVAVLDDGTPYIVMEYLDGCDLAALLCAEGKQPVDVAVSYVAQACEAIGKAHALGIVHRDLKPANLFLATSDDGSAHIKVLDFGISKTIGPTTPGQAVTATATVMGSPIYMSPEQLESSRDVDGRADVWSLGVILYELLTGTQPFVADTLPQLCKMIVDRPAPSLRGERPDVPAALEAVVAKCLAKKREDRYATVDDLLAALAPFASAESHRASKIPRALAATALPTAAVASGPRAEAIVSKSAAGARKARATAWSIAGIAVVSTCALAIAWTKVRHASSEEKLATATVDVLASPKSVLACPQLRAKGVEAPTGWLGAAAAAYVCGRAQMRLGGRPERTLVPAELLGLPRTPTDDFPHDPYVASDARDRQMAAAGEHASAYIDGDVEKRGTDFAASLQLKTPDGHELARGSGEGPTLFEAIRAAMGPIETAGAIPAAKDGDPFLLEWFGVKTAEGGEALFDLARATSDDAKAWPKRECVRAIARTDFTASVAYHVGASCDDDPPAAHHPPPVDDSTPGELARTAAISVLFATDLDGPRKLVEPLERAARAEVSPTGRSFLLEAAARAAKASGDDDRARELALLAVQSDPKTLQLGGSVAWRTLTWSSLGKSAAIEQAAWMPYDAQGLDLNYNVDLAHEVTLRWARRAYTLADDGFFAEDFAWTLLEEGRHEEAGPIIAAVGGDGLRLDLEGSYAHFGAVLARAPQMLVAHPVSLEESDRVMEISAVATQVADLMGRPADFVDTIVARYVDVEPPMFSKAIVPAYRLALSCMLAPSPVARRCFARLVALRKSGYLAGNFAGLDAVVEGGERYVSGDFRGAAKAWRRLVGSGSWALAIFETPLARAFDEAGESDLAAAVDAPFLKKTGLYNGADLAYVRGARRAEKRGDKDTARKLANVVIDAWRTADELPPAVEEMRKLLARLH